jgi:hypothetical protein
MSGTTQRGVTVGDQFTPQQLEAIELFATGEYKCQEVAAKVGVNPTTISQWRKNYQFIDAVIRRSRELLKSCIPELYSSGVLEATKGSAPHLKIILEHIEKLENIRAETTGVITFKWDEGPTESPTEPSEEEIKDGSDPQL